MTTLHVHRFGAGERTLVALHGINGHGGRFRSLADALPHHTVHAVDLRGHGHSPWLPPWTAEQHVADIIATLSLGEVDVLGFSFGGLILALDDDGRYRWRLHRPAIVTAYSEMARPAVLPPKPHDTLLVIAEQSPVVEPAYEQACREAGVEVARVDCGHQMLFDRPAETTSLVREFLN